MALKCLEFCQALTSQGMKFSFNLTTGISFSFSLDTKESEKSASPVAEQAKKKKKLSPSDVKRMQRRRQEFLKRKSEGRKDESSVVLQTPEKERAQHSADTCTSTEEWRGRHAILFTITSSYLASGLWSGQVWQHEGSLWTDFQQWRRIKSPCSSWWPFHLHSQKIFNTFSMGRMHISWKIIVSFQICVAFFCFSVFYMFSLFFMLSCFTCFFVLFCLCFSVSHVFKQ